MPFVIKLSNGDIYTIRHPELAIWTTQGSLYIFQPDRDADGEAASLKGIVSLSHINAVIPINDAAA